VVAVAEREHVAGLAVDRRQHHGGVVSFGAGVGEEQLAVGD